MDSAVHSGTYPWKQLKFLTDGRVSVIGPTYTS